MMTIVLTDLSARMVIADEERAIRVRNKNNAGEFAAAARLVWVYPRIIRLMVMLIIRAMMGVITENILFVFFASLLGTVVPSVAVL